MSIWHTPRTVRERVRSALSPVVWANFAVVTLVTFIAAVAGVVADDVLPRGAPRVIAMLVLLVVLLVALWLRNRVHRTTGTLFHVQVLAEQMADLRAGSRRSADINRMAVRSTTRWVDLDHRTSDSGVIELADLCTEVSATLEAQINADSIDTGYTLAPVMLWPIALAVGTQLPVPDRLRLLELEARRDLPSNDIALATPPSQVVITPPVTGGAPTSGRVGVLLAFTAASRHFPPASWPSFGVTTDYRLTRGDDLPGNEALSDDDVAGLGAAIATILVDIRTRHTGRELVIIAMVPKVVAVSIGWHIAQLEHRFFHGTHLMHHDGASYVPMRVKESQPGHPPRAS